MKGEKYFEVGAKGIFHMKDFKDDDFFLVFEVLKMPRPCDRGVAEVKILYCSEKRKDSMWSIGNKTIFGLNEAERLYD